jgi:transposase
MLGSWGPSALNNAGTTTTQLMPLPRLPDAVRDLMLYWHYALEKEPSEIAILARCHVTTVRRIIARYEETGETHARAPGRCPHILNQDDERFVRSLLAARPHLYLDEIQHNLLCIRHVDVSVDSISRMLDRIGWSHKCLSRRAAERNEEYRNAWKAKYGGIPARACIWMDESHVKSRDHFRRHGWAEVGLAPARVERFEDDGRVTIIPALTTEGILTMDVLHGGNTGERFVTFLREHLVCFHTTLIYTAPSLKPLIPRFLILIVTIPLILLPEVLSFWITLQFIITHLFDK